MPRRRVHQISPFRDTRFIRSFCLWVCVVLRSCMTMHIDWRVLVCKLNTNAASTYIDSIGAVADCPP